MEYKSKNRHKFLLKCHLIFVCKYRKHLLDGCLSEFIKQKCIEISENANFKIETMEANKNHIHFMISYPPCVSVSSIVRKLKQETTYLYGRSFPNYARCIGKRMLFGVMDILFVLSAMQIAKPLEITSRTKANHRANSSQRLKTFGMNWYIFIKYFLTLLIGYKIIKGIQVFQPFQVTIVLKVHDWFSFTFGNSQSVL